MKFTQTALMIAAVALTSGCAANMSATRGEFSVEGRTTDPIGATAVAGNVTTNQYRAETDRMVAMEMLDQGMVPGYTGYQYGNYGVMGGFGNDLNYYYNYVGLVPVVRQTPPANGNATGDYATQDDLRRVEEKADDSLCLHWKQRNPGRPISECPLKK